MSFLKINNPDGTSGIKRPFRLSDIQDIWNGIKSLFKAISGQPFRIISGFDLVNGVYTSGTVWYNGELYEYDSSTYPITPSTARVAFTRVAQDNRVWEDGDTLPFSYKYVCGGDALSNGTLFTYFVANIERYKSFLGNGSVATEKLADNAVTSSKISASSVTIDKLEVGQRVLPIEHYVLQPTTGDVVTIDSIVNQNGGYTNRIVASGQFSIDLAFGSTDVYMFPVKISNSITNNFIVNVFDSNVTQTKTPLVEIPAQREVTIMFVRSFERYEPVGYII